MGWLVDRLTPYKQSQPRWVDLARALEDYWDTYNTPALDRIEQMRSVFTAHGEDVEKLLSEAGIQFEVAVPLIDSNRAFAYAWRGYEIHRKDNAEVLASVLARDFSGLDVRWEPLLAPKDMPYGVGRMLTAYEIELIGADRADYYRTYRGVVMANLSGIRSVGYDTAGFSEVIARKVDALRPAHVVHEGEMFFQVFRAEIAPELDHVRGFESVGMLAMGFRRYCFDTTPADEVTLDAPPFEQVRDLVTVTPVLQAWSPPFWRLDGGEIIDGDYWGWHGVEGNRQRFDVLGHQHARQHATHTELTTAHRSKAVRQAAPSYLTLGRNPFDVMWADGDRLDVWAGVAFPGWTARQTSHGGSVARAWIMPLWGLDGGSVIDGDYWGLAGIEGSRRSRVTAHRGRQTSGFSPFGAVSSATRRAVFSLPLDTNRYNAETLAIEVGAAPAARSVTLQSSAPMVRDPLPRHPSFDDLPADLAPLDMHYEDA